MKYSDFLGITEGYITNLTFVDYVNWLYNGDFEEIERIIINYFELKYFPKRNIDDILSGILTSTNNQLSKKVRDRNYYACQSCALLFVLKKLFCEECVNCLNEKHLEKNNENIRRYSYILKNLLLDLERLRRIYNVNIKGSVENQQTSEKYVTTTDIHLSLKEALYGDTLIETYSESYISSSIVTIRQLVEIKIKRAFGIAGCVDCSNNPHPINMEHIFNTVRQHSDDISFPIKFENIQKIYSWANVYTHSGLGDYCWMPFFIDYILDDLTFGTRKHEEDNIMFSNGISASRETINMIIHDLEKTINKDKKQYKILKCTPECSVKE